MPAPATPSASDAHKRFVRRMAASFGGCTEEAKRYGACIKLHMEGVAAGACEAEFMALSKCFRAGLAKAKA